MGLALARQLLKPDHTLLCLSRQDSAALTAQAQAAGAALTQWKTDLSDGHAASVRLGAWLRAQAAADFASATLINNAAVMPAIVPLRDAPTQELALALRVGLQAPMQLTAAFLDATRAWPGVRRVLNISSGLGRRPMASQSAYCAVKAGLDHFTRCLALDEAGQPNGARVCALAPGVIDTGMQTQLRSAEAAAFPDRERFVRLQSQGQLSTPEDAAGRVLAWLARPDFGAEPVADVRQ